MNLKSLFDRAVNVVLAGGFAEQDVDGERSTGNGEAGCIVVELGELRRRAREMISGGIAGAEGAEGRTFSAFIVAEVTMSLRSRRRERTVQRVTRQ